MTTLIPPTLAGLLLFAAGVSTAVFLIAMGATAVVRSAEMRHRVWFLSFAVTGLCLGFGWLRWEVAVPVLPAPHLRPVERTVRPQVPPAVEPKQETAGVAAETVVVPNEPKENGVTPGRGWDFVLLAWVTGGLFASVPVAVGAWRWHRLRRRSEACRDEGLRDLYRKVSESLGLRGGPRLLLSREIRTPVLGSFLRPCLVLPMEAAEWPLAETESALRHELAHYQRHDLAVLFFARVMAALLWFQPLAWHGLRQLRLEAEMAADDAVVDGQEAPENYAELLLELSQRWRGQPSQPGLGIVRASQLEARLGRILDEGADRRALTRGKAFALQAGVLGVAVLLLLLKPVTANNAPALLQKIAQENQKAWENVDSLSFVERDTIVGDEVSQFQMEWWEMGRKCRYRYRQFDEMGQVDYGRSYSYDGALSRRMEILGLGTRNTLYRQKAPRDFDDSIIYRTFITTPLDFVALADPNALRTTPPLVLLKDVSKWQRFLADAELLGPEMYQGRECVAVKVKNRYLRNSLRGEDLGDYVIYFDPARAYRPAGWKAYKADGKLFQELVVTLEETARAADGRSITLPREIKTIYPAITWIARFSEVSIDSLAAFKFALDETLVNQIHDVDTGKYLPAPKQPYLSIVLPDLEFTDLPLNEVMGLISRKAKEADPETAQFSASCGWGSNGPPKFSLKMSRPTVEAALKELQRQNKGLTFETRPKGLNVMAP